MCFHQKKTEFSGSMLIYWRVIDILPRKCQKLGRPPCDRTWFHGTASPSERGRTQGWAPVELAKVCHSLGFKTQWIGLRENLLETINFPMKIMGLSCKFSLKPIHWKTVQAEITGCTSCAPWTSPKIGESTNHDSWPTSNLCRAFISNQPIVGSGYLC